MRGALIPPPVVFMARCLDTGPTLIFKMLNLYIGGSVWDLRCLFRHTRSTTLDFSSTREITIYNGIIQKLFTDLDETYD